MVSATPIPLMLDLANGTSEVDDIEFFNLEPQDDYNGVENIVPLVIDGQEIYLEQNELNCKSIYSSSDDVKVVYANDKLIALYDDALSHSEHRKGILILDCSCPRVNVSNNITVKATAVQETMTKEPVLGTQNGYDLRICNRLLISCSTAYK